MKVTSIFIGAVGWLLCWERQAVAQCPADSEILQSIVAIQNNAGITNDEKIKGLLRLQQEFFKCGGIKDSVYARIVHRLGGVYSKIPDFEKAIRYTKEAVAVNTTSKKGEKSFLANSYYNLGEFYRQLYFFDECQRHFDSCIFFGRQAPYTYSLAFMAFERKAYLFFQTGDYQKSIETADNGIFFARRIKDTLAEATLLSQRAQSQAELRRFEVAEKDIKNAIFILEHTHADTIKLATGYSIYANILNKKGNPRAAIPYYQKAFLSNKAKANWLQCSRDILDLGYLYDKDLGNRAKALACYRQGVEMAAKTADPYQLTALYINMGVAYWRQQNYGQALRFYQTALNTLPINFTDTAIKANPSVSMLNLVANDYFVSTLLANKGEALLELYKKEKKQDLLQASLSTFRLADKTVDLMRWKQYAEQSKLFWREKTKKMYEDAIEACYLLSDIETAYYFFEKSRAVLLTDKLSELGAKKFISETDRSKEQQLWNQVSVYSQQLSALTETAPSYANSKEQLFTAQQQWEQFMKSLEIKYPAYYQYKYNNVVYPVSAVKNILLQNHQSLIEFFTGDSIIYILLLSPQKNKLVKVPFPGYTDAVRNFTALCSDGVRLNQQYAAYQSMAYELYHRLLEPLSVPEGRVVVSPDDEFIPFEALLWDKKNPSGFLLKKYAFSYVYSMGLLLRSNVPSAAENSFLGVAPVNYQPHLHLPSLEGADGSLQTITSYFKKASLLTNEKATKQQFLNNLSLFKTVQVYSHADADTAGKQPVLYLSDSALQLSEIQTLENLNTDLIVLSACKTGIGRQAKGEGVFSMARAFTAAVIPSMVTTLWEIDNRATYQLTEAFYKYLSYGLPKDVALQKAKLEFLENGDKTYELPYYWAANIILGKTNVSPAKVTGGYQFPIWLLLIISFSAAGLGIFLFRKFAR